MQNVLAITETLRSQRGACFNSCPPYVKITGMEYEFIVSEDFSGKSLGSYLRGPAMVSASLVRSLKKINCGITVNGEPAKTNLLLNAGSVVRILLHEGGELLSPSSQVVPVSYESDSAIVYEKPAGMATHPTLNHPDETLANVYAALILQRGGSGASFRPVNRLDKNTSGMVLAAKDRYSAPILAESVKKSYIAVAEGEIARDGVINLPIGRQDGSIIGRCVRDDGDESITEYHVIAVGCGHTLLKVVTLTGRTHQIRVHMSSVGHPLAGDDLYGGSRKLIARHALHCDRMRFFDPSAHDEVGLSCPMPEDMCRLIMALGLKY